MRAPLALLLATLAAGCQDTDGPASQEVQLGALTFEVPADWQRHDAHQPGALTSVWTPTPNPRHESVTVVRADRPTHRADAGADVVGPQLVTASKALPGARLLRYAPLSTGTGFAGARVDLRFRPAGVTRDYQRTHVVLVEDAATLVHVIYTAEAPDPAGKATQLVLGSLARPEVKS